MGRGPSGDESYLDRTGVFDQCVRDVGVRSGLKDRFDCDAGGDRTGTDIRFASADVAEPARDAAGHDQPDTTRCTNGKVGAHHEAGIFGGGKFGDE